MTTKITEDFVKFVWQHKLFTNEIYTTENELIKVIDTGKVNVDAGPDYFCSNLIVGNINIIGNVEIHVKASDFKRHKHQNDKAYNNIILHVVYENDMPLDFPTLELKNYLSDKTIETYSTLLFKRSELACNTLLQHLPELNKNLLLDASGIERLNIKTDVVDSVLNKYENDWDATFYFLLFRNFGFNLNGEAFEQLYKSFDHNLLFRYSENFTQLLALLTGQADLIDRLDIDLNLKNTLKKEYDHLRSKHNLIPIENSIWKFLRTRPANFPTARIIQLTAVIHQYQRIFSRIKERNSVKDLINLFSSDNNFEIKELTVSVMSKSTINIILINTVAPTLFAYGKINNSEALCENALALLEELPPEDNKYTRLYLENNVKANNALQSQGCIHLHKNHCEPRKCMTCNWGNYFMRKLN